MTPTEHVSPSLPPGAMLATMEAAVGEILLLPVPPAMLGLKATIELDGLAEIGFALSDFGPQRALVVNALVDRPRALYRWDATTDVIAPDWLWHPPRSPLNQPSRELKRHVGALVQGLSGSAAVSVVLEHVAEVFSYGHGEGRFTDGTESVPLVSCGLTRGTCVDIHTYSTAALRAAQINSAYVAGVFWPENEAVADDMHCWLIVDGQPETCWDIAHDLVTARRPQPDLLALPGVRFPLSVGRGQRICGAGISVEISHFAMPHHIVGGVSSEVATTFNRIT